MALTVLIAPGDSPGGHARRPWARPGRSTTIAESRWSLPLFLWISAASRFTSKGQRSKGEGEIESERHRLALTLLHAAVLD